MEVFGKLSLEELRPIILQSRYAAVLRNEAGMSDDEIMQIELKDNYNHPDKACRHPDFWGVTTYMNVAVLKGKTKKEIEIFFEKFRSDIRSFAICRWLEEHGFEAEEAIRRHLQKELDTHAVEKGLWQEGEQLRREKELLEGKERSKVLKSNATKKNSEFHQKKLQVLAQYIIDQGKYSHRGGLARAVRWIAKELHVQPETALTWLKNKDLMEEARQLLSKAPDI